MDTFDSFERISGKIISSVVIPIILNTSHVVDKYLYLFIFDQGNSFSLFACDMGRMYNEKSD